jgi:hypothetical protein
LAGKVDAFLKISAAASIMLASASVGYYYVVYLPQRDAQTDRERKLETARAEYSRQTEHARLAAEKRDAEEKEIAAREAVQARYQGCIRSAESNYSASWATQCRRISDKSAKDYNDCVTKGQMSKELCVSMYSGRDASPSCSLPRALGTDISDELDKSRKRCLEESRAGLQ